MAARRISSVVSRSLFLRPLSSSISPRGEVIANVAEGDAEDIDCTVFAARKAFDEGPWPKVTAYVKIKSAFRSDFLIFSCN
ncbi:hypothetical protein R6Q59_019463 [Mikania micrantha]